MSRDWASEIRSNPLFRQQVFIDGGWVDADDGTTLPVDNPANRETIGEVPRLGAAETRRAIEAAGRAFGDWRGATSCAAGTS